MQKAQRRRPVVERVPNQLVLLAQLLRQFIQVRHVRQMVRLNPPQYHQHRPVLRTHPALQVIHRLLNLHPVIFNLPELRRLLQFLLELRSVKLQMKPLLLIMLVLELPRQHPVNKLAEL